MIGELAGEPRVRSRKLFGYREEKEVRNFGRRIAEVLRIPARSTMHA